MNVPTPCAKGLVGACPNTNQRPHTMCKGIGGGLPENKSTSPDHAQRDWWGLVPTQINIPTPCAKGLVGACPNTNQRLHTMCKGIGLQCYRSMILLKHLCAACRNCVGQSCDMMVATIPLSAYPHSTAGAKGPPGLVLHVALCCAAAAGNPPWPVSLPPHYPLVTVPKKKLGCTDDNACLFLRENSAPTEVGV